MTAKEAIDIAISELEIHHDNLQYQEAVKVLQKFQRKDMVMKWSKEKILLSLDTWEKQHGVPPTVTNLIEPGMPGAGIIQKYFGVKASAFLRSKYGVRNSPTKHKNKYGFTTQDDWLNCFRDQFNKHSNDQEFNSKTYNVLKDDGTPLWETIAKHCGISQWSKLLKLANVHYPNKIKNQEPGTVAVTSIKSLWLERFELAVKQREILNDKLIECIKNSDRKNDMRKKKGAE